MSALLIRRLFRPEKVTDATMKRFFQIESLTFVQKPATFGVFIISPVLFWFALTTLSCHWFSIFQLINYLNVDRQSPYCFSIDDCLDLFYFRRKPCTYLNFWEFRGNIRETDPCCNESISLMERIFHKIILWHKQMMTICYIFEAMNSLSVYLFLQS